MTMALLMTAGLGSNAGAHTESASLGATKAAVDLYEVSCATGTASLQAQVKDFAPVRGPKVSVQIIKGTAATNSADAIDADAAYSPLVSLAGGEGQYYVSVSKTGLAAEAYILEYHCMSSTGGHTDTSISTLQNN